MTTAEASAPTTAEVLDPRRWITLAIVILSVVIVVVDNTVLTVALPTILRDFHTLFAEHGYVVGKLFPDHVDFRAYDLKDEDFLGPNYLACAADDPMVARLGGR